MFSRSAARSVRRPVGQKLVGHRLVPAIGVPHEFNCADCATHICWFGDFGSVTYVYHGRTVGNWRRGGKELR